VSKVWRTITHEFFEVLPPTIFFNIVLLPIFVYCATRELVRVIGRERVWHIFFGHPGSSVARSA
jgi:hypothetical protein